MILINQQMFFAKWELKFFEKCVRIYEKTMFKGFEALPESYPKPISDISTITNVIKNT